MQETLLGISGVRLLRELGLRSSVFHMDTGHAAFLTLEFVREKMAAGQSRASALRRPPGRSARLHRPHAVEAGHDRLQP